MAKFFLKLFSLHHHHALWGDIEEIYHDKMKEKGNIKARVTHQGKRLDKDVAIKLTSVDYDYPETLKINILEGRSFSRQYGNEARNVMVNKTFAHLLGTGSAVNQKIKLKDTPFKIIGVTRDFHISSVKRGDSCQKVHLLPVRNIQ